MTKYRVVEIRRDRFVIEKRVCSIFWRRHIKVYWKLENAKANLEKLTYTESVVYEE